MRYAKSAMIPGIAMLLASAAAGCSDSEDTKIPGRGDASADTDDTDNTDSDDTDTTDSDDTDTTDSDDTKSTEDDAGSNGADGLDAGADDTTDDGDYPTFPSTLSLTGCSGIGPLCTVMQDGGELTANCGGLAYAGLVTEDGNVTLTAAPETTNDGAVVTRICEGELSNRGQFTAECTVVTSVDDVETSETCELESDPVLQPSVECMQLPKELSDVELCVEGAEAGGETIAAGTCSVVQDGCSFQADCADGTTLTGSVSMSGISFSQVLPALADAETPAEGGEPQFLAGALVSHSCSAALDGTSLVGECGAGRAGRGGTNTSICSVGGDAEEPAQCEPLSSLGDEQIFVLDSCDALKNGEGGEPGIGEPLCAFRQNNCVWEIQCGRGMVYTGQIEPGVTDFEWRLDTGTRCEGSFSEAGEFSGVCAVPDLFSCDLGSKAPEPGDDSCPSAPIGEEITSRGCGNATGDRMDCREVMWHGCDFMALCSFAHLESLVFAGKASEDDGAGRLDFSGIGDWTCHVEAPTPAALQSDPYRSSNEWIGQCETAEGGLCRDNFDPATGEGFRGLQLFWGEADEPEPQTDAGVESDAGADAGE